MQPGKRHIGVWLLAGTLAASLLAAAAQSAPAFEVASVKPFVAGKMRPSPFRTDPVGLHVAGVALDNLICYAYEISPYQLHDNLKWTRMQRFAIDATTTSPAAPQAVRGMLRRLLSDRFGLRLDTSKRLTPVLALVLAKHGAKLRRLGPFESPNRPTEGSAEKVYIASSDSINGLVGFLNYLSGKGWLDRPVVDRTGMTGRFNIWLKVRTTALRTKPAPDCRDVPAALSRDLGLALVPETDMITTYSVRVAHPPTPN